MTREELAKRFVYHAPREDQIVKYNDIRSEIKKLAVLLCELTPDCREQSIALTHLEEVVFWANAAIARNPEAI
jgi:hypothetical protein